jgi:hypothetical protein
MSSIRPQSNTKNNDHGLSLARPNPGEAPLTESDFRGLAAIPRDIIEAAGLFRVDTLRGAELVGVNRPRAGDDYAGIIFPYRWPGEESRPRGYRLRRDHPGTVIADDGRVKQDRKYMGAPGDANRLYFPPSTSIEDLSSSIPIIITEGEKKTLALAGFYRDTLGQPALIVGLSGVWNWRGSAGKTVADNGQRVDIKGPLPDLDAIRWKERDVLIVFDANTATNQKVASARRRLRNMLLKRGAAVRLVDIPPSPTGGGVDDLLITPDGPRTLEGLIDHAMISGADGRVLLSGNTHQDLPVAAEHVWEALDAAQQKTRSLFWYGGLLQRGTSHGQRYQLEQCNADVLSYELEQIIEWWRGMDPEEGKRTHAPKALVRHMLSAPMASTPLPVLSRIVYSPVFSRDGDLITTPGFHPASGIYYHPCFEVLQVPDVVTPGDLEAARELIDGWLLCDFPFATGADRCHAVGLLLLPFVRDLIEGATPLHLIEASTPGSGKGLLANALLYPALGDSLATMTQPTHEEEWGKAITSALMSGADAVLIDNLAATLDSGKLASALTGTIWRERVLGGNKTTDAPIRQVWAATGNNPILSGEMTRRSVRIRLEPNTDTPEERTGFKIEDLSGWAKDHRSDLVRAALVIVRHWIQAGRPGPAEGTIEEASYRLWWKVIGGILGAAGYRGFLANRREFRERANTERAAHAAFCHEWYEWAHQNRRHLGATTAELMTIAQRMEDLPVYGNTEHAIAQSMGRYLNRSVGVVSTYRDPDTGEESIYRISAGKVRKGSKYWLIDRG